MTLVFTESMTQGRPQQQDLTISTYISIYPYVYNFSHNVQIELSV